MRHGNAFRKLNKNSSHRLAMLRNMATALVINGRISTTLPKAKELKKVADKLITLGKKNSLHSRRQALGYLMAVDREATGNVQKKTAVHKLFTELAPQFSERSGGYTRVIRYSDLRDADKAEMAMIEFEDNNERYGKFIVEPLERGYGTTIGNSLRRIMLSSLQGAAITEVQIEGVKHEFSTIPGCMEDVTEIVLNLKNVVLDLGEKETANLEIDIKGPAEVTAGMIKTDGAARVLNPLLPIASINEECHLKMTMSAKTGRGYVVSEANKQEDSPVGTIALDAMFSPVRKVNHNVTNARVGQRTDYDKLTLEVWTDGSISPESAIKDITPIPHNGCRPKKRRRV